MNDAPVDWRPSWVSGKARERDFTIAPNWVLREVVRTRAWYALPLILVAHTRMRMKRRQSTPLTRAVWLELGPLNQTERHAVLAHLKRVPQIMELTVERRHRWRYRLSYGPLWAHPPPPPEPEDED